MNKLFPSLWRRALHFILFFAENFFWRIHDHFYEPLPINPLELLPLALHNTQPSRFRKIEAMDKTKFLALSESKQFQTKRLEQRPGL